MVFRFICITNWSFIRKNSKKRYATRSAHQTTNFMTPEFQFPQFKMLQNGFYLFKVKLYWHCGKYCDVNLNLYLIKILKKEINKKFIVKFGIRNWLFDELNEIMVFVKWLKMSYVIVCKILDLNLHSNLLHKYAWFQKVA